MFSLSHCTISLEPIRSLRVEDLLRKSRIRSIESKITCTAAASVVNAHIVVATKNLDVIFVESSTRLSKGFPNVRDRVRSILVANEAIH
jgi:hypothetical protein